MSGKRANAMNGRIPHHAAAGGRQARTKREPFRVPAGSFYALSVLFSIVVALFVGMILFETGDASAANWALLSGGACFVAAVLFREVILRGRRRQMLARERRLISNVSGEYEAPPVINKLTVEHNSALIRSIQQKSEAANVLGGLADGHKEVFILCEEYLDLIKSELPRVAPGSPRFAAFRKGTVVANRLHYEHMVRWARLEAAVATERRSAGDPGMRSARAIEALEMALFHYPEERVLIELREAISVSGRGDGLGKVIDVEGAIIESEP